ncbi:hypothetical protein ACIQWA_40380 [Kitasatospora sp. NPDC098652]|uniref:hypothetical protein n=1 Tax=Kitasatospora sp. NPDC098652 TaxID=3364095 RepID=UPI0038306AA3
MSILENAELAFRLRDLAEESAPPPAFDATVSIARGRARLRARQGAAIGAVAVATALTIGITAMAPRIGNTTPAVSPASATTAADPTPSPADKAVDGIPALTSELKVGWLPDWVDREHGIGYSAGTFGSSLTADEPKLAYRRLLISLLAPGPEPALGTRPDEAKVPAPPINGRTAYWVEHPSDPRYDSSDRVLRWQTADGRWAVVRATHLENAVIPDGDLIRIAESVTGGSRDVPMPLWLSGLPAWIRPDSASVLRYTGYTGTVPWEARIVLAIDGKTVTLTAAPEGELRDVPPTSQCRHEGGLQVCASTAPELLPRLDPIGGLAGLLKLAHVTGADESTWTTSNLR